MASSPTTMIRVPLRRELFDYLVMALSLMLLLNVVIALAFLDSNQEGYLHIRKEGFRMAACWVILLTITLSSAQLRSQRIVVLVLGVLLGAGIQYLSMKSAIGAENVRLELGVSVVTVYFALPTVILLLLSTKVDDLENELEKERLTLQRAGGEASRLVDLLKKARETKEPHQDDDDETLIVRRKLLLGISTQVYGRMVRVRFRRDVNALLQELFETHFGFRHGFVIEVAEEGREARVKNVWGVPQDEASIAAMDTIKDGPLVAWVIDRREPIDRERVTRQPALFETWDRMGAELFAPDHVIPIVSLNKTVNVVVLGGAPETTPLPFELPPVEPILAAAGLVLAKLMGKTGKPQFATFGT